MSTNRAAVAALVLMGLTGSSSAADPSTLRWKFQKGDVLKYEFRQKNDLTLKAAGQELKNLSELTFNVRWDVKSVADDGAAKVAMKVERVRAHVKNGPQTINFDSSAKGEADPAATAISSAYREVVGPEYQLTIDAKGKIVEAKVPDAVKESLKGSPFQNIADGGSVLSDSGVKNMFLQVIPVFPDKPLAQGGTWDTTMELPTGPLTVKLKETYTLAKSTPDAVTIEAKLSTKMEPVAGVALTVDMKKESGDATFTFDAKAGRISKSSVHQTMDVTLKGGNGELDQNIAIEVSFAIVPDRERVPQAASGASPMIRTVVVGYGLAGRAFHAPLIRRQKNLELYGVVARDARVRASAVSELSVMGFGSLDEALADPLVDLVVIATPHDSHAELTVRSLGAGKHCVVDKVMALTTDEADRMIAARDRSRRMLSVFQNRRWDWDYLTVRAHSGTA